MNESRAKGCLLAALIWCVILALLGVGYKFGLEPYLKKKRLAGTISSSQYDHELVLAADSFSGYCVLRSEAMKQDLKARRIKWTVEDDKADYPARIRALKEGSVQFAVFTIDSLISAGARLGEFPGTIVLVIDETKGGDAMVAYQSGLPSLQHLDHPTARIVLTPNSPSEFLARVVIAHFQLPNLPEKWAVEADGARAVFTAFAAGNPAERKAYVLWEPYVSRALERKGAHVLIDSSKLKGYIVDVLVVQREFLRDKPQLSRTVVEAYLRAAYAAAQKPDGWAQLVAEDARLTGSETLDPAQARKIVGGVQWKNTLENYAHFGLVPAAERGQLAHLEDMIANIVEVLVKTGALPADPLGGKHHTLFFNDLLAQLKGANFHPAKGLNLIPGVGPGLSELEKVRPDRELKELTPEQWNSLRAVGELKIEPIVFLRASARIGDSSQRDLEELARRLQSLPQYYVRVIGHARPEGDPEANRLLAQTRAETVARALTGLGLPAQRLRTEASTAARQGGEAQAVSFVVGQVPF